MIIDYGNTTIPLWELLSYGDQVALITYQKKHYPKKPLNPHGVKLDIIDFDADKEMRKTSNPSRESMR